MVKRYARITGWGKYTPERVMTNFDLEKMVETSDEWIRTRTGIHERRIAGEGEQTSDLAVAAAQNALEVAGLSVRDLDLIIVATSTPDYHLPSVASIVQNELGADCGAFTLGAGCTGFVYGLSVGSQFIEAGSYETVLVIGVEIISRFLNWDDRTTCVIFGDGAGAVVLQASDEPTGLLAFELGSDGGGAEHLIVRGAGTVNPMSPEVLNNDWAYLEMNGREVFKFAARTLGRSLRRVLDEANLSPDDIDLFIPHQANIRIVEVASRLMRVSEDKFYMNIQRYGNTSAASVPIALCEALDEGRANIGDTLAFVAFGAGLTWASAVVHLGGPTANTRAAAHSQDDMALLDRARSTWRRAMGTVQDTVTGVAFAVGERFNIF